MLCLTHSVARPWRPFYTGLCLIHCEFLIKLQRTTSPIKGMTKTMSKVYVQWPVKLKSPEATWEMESYGKWSPHCHWSETMVWEGSPVAWREFCYTLVNTRHTLWPLKHLNQITWRIGSRVHSLSSNTFDRERQRAWRPPRHDGKKRERGTKRQRKASCCMVFCQ